MEDLGFRFWAWIVGGCVAVAIVLFIAFMLFSKAIYAWGILGAFLAVAVVMIVAGWLYDRHEAHHDRAPSI